MKLTKRQHQDLTEKWEALQATTGELQTARETAVAAIEAAATAFRERVAEATEGIDVGPYTEARVAFVDALNELHDELSDEWEDKSESWQEKDAGQEARAWIDEFSNFGLEIPEFDPPSVSLAEVVEEGAAVPILSELDQIPESCPLLED